MKKILTGIIAFGGGVIGSGYFLVKTVIKPTIKELSKAREMSEKHYQLYMLMNDWVKVKQNNNNLSMFFTKNGYKKIAIYGMNYVGQTLLEELDKKDVEVIAGIDKNADNLNLGIEMYTPDSFNKEVDAVVVTPITFFDDIADMLEKKVNCPIISIEDVIYELLL